MRTQTELDERWDKHTERQISASKGAATAVTVLNSGSWLALLSQASSLANQNIGWSIGFWGFGALLGTAVWLCIYISAIIQYRHDINRQNQDLAVALDRNSVLGVSIFVASLVCFAVGVVSLAITMS